MQLQMPRQAAQVVCNGIIIEEGLGGCLYLRVNCMDRPGLLSDIMMALRNMPLDVSSTQPRMPALHAPRRWRLLQARALGSSRP
jgi:hypothetical protein